MQSNAFAGETRVSHDIHHATPIVLEAATACLVWYTAVAVVCAIGYTQLWRHYSAPRARRDLANEAPHVTIVRPVKGLEPCLYECLASTFRQDYPQEKMHVRLCVSSRTEASLPILQRLLKDFPGVDAQILVEAEDAVIRNRRTALGPNPKIRNMSRAYREAIGDIIWIIDCNVWVAKGVCGRMVGKLQGDGTKHPNKFVHQLPLVVDVVGSSIEDEGLETLNGHMEASAKIRTTSTAGHNVDSLGKHDRNVWSIGGGRLEELFMSSSHAKFYTAINTVLIAPCIVGKSTMFRRSHLGSLTKDQGIDYFSQNICEDHLIGDLLWKQQVPEEKQGQELGKHALCFGDLAVQPMANMSVREYWSRRVRWLRVRKFTVTLATLVEPGTESFLCSFYGAFAISTLPIFHDALGVPQSWATLAIFWLLSVSIWCVMDWTLYLKLHSAASIGIDEQTPIFARSRKDGRRRPFGEWLLAWLGRETLALPIWLWAFYGGTKVEWRGKKFWVGMDMKVHEITEEPREPPREMNGHAKARLD